MVFLILIVIIAIAFMVSGSILLYSVFSKKIITPPEPNALFQLRVQYKLRGVIGIAFIIIGLMMFYGIFKT